jgi:CheY-like chemotaxis protein
MSTSSIYTPIKILLVDDNPGDVRLTREALNEGRICHELQVAINGEEALTMLRGQGEKGGATRPDIILLDLNLPGRNGLEILAEIKADVELKRIPVVILSTSGAEQDVRKAYGLHANCYIVKPLELDKFIEVVRSLENFWINVVRHPGK